MSILRIWHLDKSTSVTEMTLVQAQYHQLIMTGNVNLSLYSII
jgi:hypothetical protein